MEAQGASKVEHDLQMSKLTNALDSEKADLEKKVEELKKVSEYRANLQEELEFLKVRQVFSKKKTL